MSRLDSDFGLPLQSNILICFLVFRYSDATSRVRVEDTEIVNPNPNGLNNEISNAETLKRTIFQIRLFESTHHFPSVCLMGK